MLNRIITTAELYKIYLKSPEISIDSRKIEKGCLFFALKGDRFDANLFAATAIENGAGYAVVDKEDLPFNEKFIFVANVLESLQELARMHRSQLKIPVIGITGSNGKTTTKELFYRVLSKKYKVFATPGNYNNHIGLPFSILQIDNSYEMAVLEFGANHQGENEFLCHMAQPDYGITTNIGKDHLGEFGGFDGVVKAYSEFTDYFNAHPAYQFFLNDDDEILNKLVDSTNTIRYGTNPAVDCRGKITRKSLNLDVAISSRMTGYTADLINIHSPLFGDFNLPNILAAVCIGQYFRVPATMIKEAIESYKPVNNRSQIVQNNQNTYIFDAYNANPSSMKLAIESFSKLENDNKIIVLGDMFELGRESEKEHLEILDLIQKLHFQVVVLVGKEFGKIKDVINCQWFENHESLKYWLDKQQLSGYTFLIKGSRGVMLEKAFGFYLG